MIRAALFLLLALAALPSASFAQALSCSPANLGQTVCQAEGRCRCAYSQGGTMLRQPPGYYWDCDLLLGRCAPGSTYPLLAANPLPLPPSAVGGPGRPVTPADVRSAQQGLSRMGFDPGPVDGVIGPRTRAAVERYQRSVGLQPTGSLTPELIDRLR